MKRSFCEQWNNEMQQKAESLPRWQQSEDDIISMQLSLAPAAYLVMHRMKNTREMTFTDY